MGQVYTSGGIALTDTSGGTVVDSSGIVGTHAFSNYGVLYLPDLPDVTGTAYADIGSATQNIVTSRNSIALLMVSSLGNSGDGSGTIQMVLGGTAQDSFLKYSTTNETRSTFNITPIGSGTTIFKLQGICNSGTARIEHGGGYLHMGYLVLGK